MSNSLVSAVLSGGLAVGLLATGCLNQERPCCPPPPPGLGPYLPQDSPANCLTNLKTAYVDRDLDAYSELFSNDFTFVFNPDSTAGTPTPPTWSLTIDSTMAASMFHSEPLDKIELTFLQSTAASTDSTYAGTWRVNLSSVNLLLYTHRQDGTPWLYRTNNSTATFYFKEYPGEHASNDKPLWKIWRWDDEPGKAANPLVVQSNEQVMSWGGIKLLYWYPWNSPSAVPGR